MRKLTIDGQVITDGNPCYVIAELGHNHGGSVTTAQAMIDAAADAGCDAVKFQCRHNATLYSPALLKAPYENENSYGKTYGEHRAALELPKSALRDLFAYARQFDLTPFATAFDEPSVDLLMGLQAPALKLASGSLTDRPLLEYAAHTQGPIILSTGGGTMDDIDRAVGWILPINHRLALLHCTASYPPVAAEVNLRVISTLRERFPDLVIGFSSHSPGIALSLVAVALGARIFEHHFTLSRASKGTDHGFSLEPKGMATLCEDTAKIQMALGTGVKQYYDSERKPISKMRRRQTPIGWQITGALDD